MLGNEDGLKISVQALPDHFLSQILIFLKNPDASNSHSQVLGTMQGKGAERLI